MNVSQLWTAIRKKNVVTEELPLSLQLGLPELIYRDHQIILVFSPYSERVIGDCYERHYSTYRLEFRYPSLHLRSFGTEETGAPTGEILSWDLTWIRKQGIPVWNGVLRELDQVLSLYDTYQRSSSSVIEEYEQKRKAAQTLYLAKAKRACEKNER